MNPKKSYSAFKGKMGIKGETKPGDLIKALREEKTESKAERKRELKNPSLEKKEKKHKFILANHYPSNKKEKISK